MGPFSINLYLKINSKINFVICNCIYLKLNYYVTFKKYLFELQCIRINIIFTSLIMIY